MALPMLSKVVECPVYEISVSSGALISLCEKEDRYAGRIHWSLQFNETCLLEISIHEDTQSICGIAVVAYDRRLVRRLEHFEHPQAIRHGVLPRVDLGKIWKPGARNVDEDFKSRYVREHGDFHLSIGASEVVISTMPEVEAHETYVCGRVFLGLSSEMELCTIGLTSLESSELDAVWQGLTTVGGVLKLSRVPET